MRRAYRLAAFFALYLCTQFAFGDGDLMITIVNDSSDNVLVTIYDRSTSPPQQILAARPIYGNASLTVSISADGGGKGHLSWTAMSIDRDMRRCAAKELSNLHDGDSVNVYADNDCG